MAFTQDFRTQRRNHDDGETRIGEKDRLWYDSNTNTIRISDGETPGGVVVGGSGGGGDYTLPTASTTTKGGVKVDGTTITINNQIISAVQQDLSSYATQTYVTTRGYLTSVGTISYTDLSNKPTLFSGSYTDLTNKPTLFDGAYASLTGKPTIYTSAYIGTTSLDFTRESASQTLTGVSIDGSVVWTNSSPAPGTPWRTTINAASGNANIVLYSGLPGFGSSVSWTLDETKLTFPDTTEQTTAWTGSIAYASVTGTPTLATVATSGSYADLSSKPTIYTSAYIGTTSLAFNRSSASQTLNGVSIDGNAATATSAATLTTARNINGVSFNGSASISIPSITDGTNTLKIVAAPSSLTGAVGDAVGNVAFDSSYIYYCTTAYVGNSYTGTFLYGEGASNSYQITISNNWNPTLATPAAGWTVTFNPGGGNITRTISSVASWSNSYPNGYWTLNLTSSWTGTVYVGDSFTITSSDPLPTIWKRTPWNAITNTFTFNVAADDSTLREISTDETVKFIGAGGITTASDAEGAITITQSAAAAGTLTGSTLASGVTASSLTSLGTLSGLTVGGTGGDLTMTGGAITGVGNITAAGILAVNASGGITTNQTAFDIVNSTATTVNIGGAATAVNIGATTGTLTVNNPTVVGSQTTQAVFDTVATTVTAFRAATTATIGATTGTLTLRNPTVVGTQTTVNLWNTTSTTVNAFGAATTIAIGAGTGTTTVNNDLSMASGKTIGTTGTVTSNHATAFSAGDSAISNVALSVPRDAAVRDRTNGASTMYFDVSNGGTTNGTFTFRSSSNFTELLSMTPAVFNVNTGATFTARTPSLARTAFNAAIDTEITVDEMRFRISNSGGIFPQVIGNTSSRNLAWTVVAARAGSAVTQAGSTGTIVANNAWTSLYTFGGMDSAGDTFTATLQDKALGRIYRVTFMRSDDGTTTGYNIIAERLL